MAHLARSVTIGPLGIILELFFDLGVNFVLRLLLRIVLFALSLVIDVCLRKVFLFPFLLL